MSEDNYQDLGMGEVGPTTMSDIALEAQAQKAFDRLAHRVPPEISERFIRMGMEACRQAGARSNDGYVSVEELVGEFEQILRQLIDER